MILLPHTEVVGEGFSVGFVEPNAHEIKAAWDLLRQLSGRTPEEEVTLKFAEPVSVRVTQENSIVLTEARVRLIVPQSGTLRYSCCSADEFPVSSLETERVVEIAMGSKQGNKKPGVKEVARTRDNVGPRAAFRA